jgi:hypothetical protein
MRLLFLLASVVCLLASLLCTWALPRLYLGRLGGSPATVGLPSEHGLAVPARVDLSAHPAHLSWAQQAWLDALCLPGGAAAAAAGSWLAAALQAEGLEAEVLLASAGEGLVVSSVLRAGGGAAGASTLVLAAPLPGSAAGVAGVAAACAAPQLQRARLPATPQAAVHLLALARTLQAQPWRAADIALVFYSDSAGNGSSSSSSSSSWGGPLGQLGCPSAPAQPPSSACPAGLQAAHASPALAHWVRTAQGWAAPWLAHGGAAQAHRLAQAWQQGSLRQWASALTDSLSGVAAPAAGAQPAAWQCPHCRPLRHPLAPIRAAIILELPAASTAPLPTHWAILTQGANGRQPDLDLYATLLSTLRPPLTVQEGQSSSSSSSSSSSGLLWAAAWALLWGPTGPHGDFLAAGAPAVTLRPAPGSSSAPAAQPPATASLALGHWLLGAVRALNGLDESLHAGPRSYLLLGSGQQHYLPFPEYIIPLALLHLPVLLLLLGPSPVPTARQLAGGAALWACSAAPSALAYAVLQHPGRLQALVQLVAQLGPWPSSSLLGGHSPHLTWAAAAAALELALGGAAAWQRSSSSSKSQSQLSAQPSQQLSPAIAFSLLLLGCTFLPLAYFNAPLLWLGNTAAVWLLVGAAAAQAALGGSSTAGRGLLLAPLWLLTSPLAGMAAVACWGGREGLLQLSEGIHWASSSHATYGALQLPLILGLWVPIHLAIAL